GIWQASEIAQHRRAELMQASERKLHLGLNAHCSRHTETRRLLLQVIQQHCRAYSSLAAQDQDLALPGPRLSQQPVQRRQLSPPATQSEPGMTVGHRPPPRRERMRCRASDLTSQPDALIRPASKHQSKHSLKTTPW